MRSAHVLFISLLMVVLAACEGTAIPRSDTASSTTPLPTPHLEFPRVDETLVAAPVPVEDVLARGDQQINHWISHDSNEDASLTFVNRSDVSKLPQKVQFTSMITIPTSFATAARINGPGFIPSSKCGTLTRNWVETIAINSTGCFDGVLLIGGSFHLEGEQTHDSSVMVLLDHQQVEFSLGGRMGLRHVVRTPRDKEAIYDFKLKNPIPPGNHTISVFVNWDPWNFYVIRDVQTAFSNQGRRRGGPFLFRDMNVSHKYVYVDNQKMPPLNVKDLPPVQDDSNSASPGPFIISRGKDLSDEVWRMDQALGADEPGIIYAYVRYMPPAEAPELYQGLAVITAFLDDVQIPIQGEKALFWRVEGGKQYQIPIQIDFPKDQRVHSLYINASWLPFLPSKYFSEPLPGWITTASSDTANVVPIVPSRELIPWLPSIDR